MMFAGDTAFRDMFVYCRQTSKPDVLQVVARRSQAEDVMKRCQMAKHGRLKLDREYHNKARLREVIGLRSE